MHWTIAVLTLVLGLIGGGIAGYLYRKEGTEKKIGRTEEYAKHLYEDAVRKAEEYKKEKILEAKEQILRDKAEHDQQRAEADRELRERRTEVQRAEKRLDQREETLDKKDSNLTAREETLTRRDQELVRRENNVREQETAVQAMQDRQQTELERIAAMTQDEARQQVVEQVTRDAYRSAAATVRDIEATAKEEGEKKARNIIALAIQRCAADHVAETTVSSVTLPNEDMKGRLIGREGRNIRALENRTGAELIIDDTPDTVIVSAFDPVRREIARLTVEHLVTDGRIHPARIEEVYERAKSEVEQTIRQAGDTAVFDSGIGKLHPELVKLLGRLKFRTSYGQNVLKHSLEVCYLAGLMASELGADVQLAKRAGLLHDIGKAVDHETEGSHVTLGAELARKFGESPDVVHIILAHHNDVEPQTVEAVLVQAADAISAARPGARRESLENYIKRLEKLEEIANSFEGVEKCYAFQSGREVRIMVKPDDITDEGTKVMAREIAARIEQEMQYPGQIRVSVIRETRATEYAK
ncbi:MAG: ribonuclease Y [Clostridia bacterium]|nr:ribonuclease Y [Clostridia bacterium]